ncbi:MAG: protein TolR [Defluviicoccus sp.]
MAGFVEQRPKMKAAGFRRTRPMSEINVTPLVDVMLVLLIIFMITAPLLATGVQVDLPKASTSPIPDQEKPVMVTVNRDGQVFVGEQAVGLDGLINHLSGVDGSDPERRILVRGDEAINYGQVMRVISAIHTAGFRRVSLLTAPPASATEPPRRAGSRP